MAKANTVETIEEYLLRLGHALAPAGEFWQNELLPQRRTRHMVKVSFSAPKERTVADIAREVELQLRDIGLWREGLSVKVKDFDWECCEIQNEGCSLIGTLWVEFGVWGGGALLWSAHANLLCDHDLTNGLGDDKLDGLDELDDDEAAWWLAHGVDVEEVSDFDCPLIDMGEVEFPDRNEKTSCVRSINSIKLVKTEEDAEPKQGIEGLVFDDGFVSITREEWRDRFPLVENVWGMVEWDSTEVPASLDSEYLWTDVQVDEGFAVYNGFCAVNRYCHYISTVPVSGDLRIQVWDEPWTADEQAFVRTAITAWQRAHGLAEDVIAPDDFEQWFIKTYVDRAELVEDVLICNLICDRFRDLEVYNRLEDCPGEDEDVYRSNAAKLVKSEGCDGPLYRGVGWKQQGNSAYEPLLLKRTLYEVGDPEFDDYRVERQRIVDAIPRELCAEENDITLYAHFFLGPWDWYVATYDPETDEAYCFVVGIDEKEWGAEWLRALETLQVPVRVQMPDGKVCQVPGPYLECDICWQPITFGELKARRAGAKR